MLRKSRLRQKNDSFIKKEQVNYKLLIQRFYCGLSSHSNEGMKYN